MCASEKSPLSVVNASGQGLRLALGIAAQQWGGMIAAAQVSFDEGSTLKVAV